MNKARHTLLFKEAKIKLLMKGEFTQYGTKSAHCATVK